MLSPSRLPSLAPDALTPASAAEREVAPSMPTSLGADRPTSRTRPQPRTAIGSRHEELNTSHDRGGRLRPKTRSDSSRSPCEITDPPMSFGNDTCSDSIRPDRPRLRLSVSRSRGRFLCAASCFDFNFNSNSIGRDPGFAARRPRRDQQQQDGVGRGRSRHRITRSPSDLSRPGETPCHLRERVHRRIRIDTN